MSKNIFTAATSILLLAPLVLTSCSKSKPTAVVTTGSITGVVIKASDSTIIAGATVVTNPVTISVLTDTTGQYIISEVAAGTYTISAKKNGYYVNSAYLDLSARTMATVKIALHDTVAGNHAPDAPSSPGPSDTATITSTTQTLSWISADADVGDTLNYTIYLGTTNPPITIVSFNRRESSLFRSNLSYGQDYYWKVFAKDNHGAMTEGPVWHFTVPTPKPMEWISIPAGYFPMGYNGSPILYDFAPQHQVYLDAYQITKNEITNAQYKAFMDAGGYSNSSYWTTEGWTWRTSNNVCAPDGWEWNGYYNLGPTYPNYPVVFVTWYEAYAYAKWAGGHLPTEAQWEKAARGTDSTYNYPWGSEWDGSKFNSWLNTPPDTFNQSSPVGFFSAGQSVYGVNDMAGNIEEWCNDWYASDYYSQSPDSNPQGPASSSYGKVLRGGGSWWQQNGYPCTAREHREPYDYYFYIGFRIVK